MFVPPADTHGRGGSYEEHVCLPLAQGLLNSRCLDRPLVGPTRQSDRQLVCAVKVSAVMIDVIPEPVNSPVPAGLANSSTNNTPPLVRQLELDDDFSLEEVVLADFNFCNSVVGGPTSMLLKSNGLIVDLAGDVTVGVSSLAELAGDVTVGVSSPADLAGNVTVGVSGFCAGIYP